MKTSCLALVGAAAVLAAPFAEAAQYVYPAHGQDAATQSKDETECATWATQQTGFAPGGAPATASQSSNPLGALTGTPTDTSAITSALGAVQGGGMGGMGGLGGMAGTAGAPIGGGGAGGAASALGAIGGGDMGGMGGLGGAAGMAGAAGALTGGGGGAVTQVAGLAEQALAKPAPHQVGQADFDRARAACLTGRGYTVQ
jgi:hypothetical protein